MVNWQAWWNGIGVFALMAGGLALVWWVMVWSLDAIHVPSPKRDNAATLVVCVAALLMVGVVAGAFPWLV